MPHLRRGFTLIELLVVVTIIVILLAILVPALGNAMYQGELAKCSSNVKAICTGAVVYSQSNKMFFHYRDAIEQQPMVGGELPTQKSPDGNVSYADVLKATPGNRYRRINTLAEGPEADDRNRIFAYIPAKALVDPLCGGNKLDLTNTVSTSGVDTAYVYSDYMLFFGMHYEKKGTWMRKFGTPMRLTDHFYTTMAADLNVYNDNASAEFSSITSHPDKDGFHPPIDGDPVGFVPAKAALRVRNNEGGYLDAMWGVSPANGIRGQIDFNQGLWDGSVRRFLDQNWDQTDTDGNEEYFSDVTWQADGNWYGGAIEFWGEGNQVPGDYKDPERPPATLNP